VFYPDASRLFRCLAVVAAGGLLPLLSARTAGACSCSGDTTLLWPWVGGELARGAPLVVQGAPQTTWEARCTEGESVPLTSLLTLPALGTCAGEVSLIALAKPLAAGSDCVLVSTLAHGSATESQSFTVGEEAPVARSVPVDISVSLERMEPRTFSSGLCVDSQQENREISGALRVKAVAPPGAPIIVKASIEDSVYGSLSDAWARVQPRGQVHEILLATDTRPCVEVELTDLSAQPLFREMLCVEGDEPLTRSLELTLLTVPEPPEEPESSGSDTAAPGCTIAAAPRSTSCVSSAWLAATLVLLSRRRGQKSRQ